MSAKAEENKIPEEFPKIIKDFVGDIKTTFPEFKKQLYFYLIFVKRSFLQDFLKFCIKMKICLKMILL